MVFSGPQQIAVPEGKLKKSDDGESNAGKRPDGNGQGKRPPEQRTWSDQPERISDKLAKAK